MPYGAGTCQHQPPAGDRQQMTAAEEAFAILAGELGTTEDAPLLALTLEQDAQ